MSIRVGWDLDGVFFLFAESVWETLVQLGERTGPMPPVTHWSFYEDEAWGCIKTPEFVEFCNKGADMGIIFSYGGYDLDAIHWMNTLYLAGYETVIVTDRSFGSTHLVSQRITTEQLKIHGAMYDEIHFTADKAKVNLDYMIDDKVENFLALQEAGVQCYLLDRPWNQHVEAYSYRLTGIDQYARLILEESAQTLPVYGSAHA